MSLEILKNLRVLYAEDEEAMLEQMRRALEDEVAYLRCVSNGLEAKEAFEKEHYDVVITDVQMPLMDGLALSAEIKKKNPDFPIIITSAFNDEEYLIEAIDLGVKRYLFKPINLDMLHAYLLDIAQIALLKRQFIQKERLLEQYRMAIDASAIVSKADSEGVITYVNDAFCRISGYPSEALIGRKHNVVRHPDMPVETFENLWQTIKGEQVWRGTLHCRTATGEDYYVDTVIVPTQNEEGQTEYLAIRYDATLREKQFKKQRDEQENLLIQQSKLAAMGEMIGMIAHQWRQPLSAINALTLKARTDSELGLLTEETMSSTFDRINEITEHLSTTINDFRSFFKPDSVDHWAHIGDLVERALLLIGQSFENKAIKITREIESGIDPVMIHSGRVVQVLINLLKNAQDVIIERAVGNPVIVIRAFRRGAAWVIEVEDNAGGVDQESLSRIFDPYFSTKGENGTGLGLYMSRMIMERYCRGSLSVENRNGGACFILTIGAKEGEE
ncbi:MAG: response regulator [Campylobacterales bacterium]